MKQKPNYLIGALLVSIGIIVGVMTTTLVHLFTPQLTQQQKSYDEIDYLFDILKDYSYFYKSDEELKDGALKGIMESLDDPYSVYFSEEEYNRFNSDLNNNTVGAGINIALTGSYPIITNTLDNSPAHNAGLRSGDTIIKVNNIDLKNKTFEEIVTIIRGNIGDSRTFEVCQDDISNTSKINFKLDRLQTRTVIYDYFEKNQKKIGYVDISIFGQSTYIELITAMNYLESKDIDKLIIDVRGNPGGLLDSVQNVLDYYLNSNKPFMYEETRDEEKVAYYINKNSHEIDYDIVILMDEYSASAAEIFVSAMNELGGYPLVGNTTFGKGTVQILIPINPKETKNIKFTTDRWLTSNGEWIHGIGIEPTVSVELTNFMDLTYIDGSNILKYDMVNEQVKALEIFLTQMGYETRTDGYFDEKTVLAVKAYQEFHQLEKTGMVDRKTAYQINLDLNNYAKNKKNDNQYQKALEYLLMN